MTDIPQERTPADIRYPNWLQLIFDILFHRHKSETPADIQYPPSQYPPLLDILVDIRYPSPHRNPGWYPIFPPTLILVKLQLMTDIPQERTPADIRYPNWLQLIFDVPFHRHKSETPADIQYPLRADIR